MKKILPSLILLFSSINCFAGLFTDYIDEIQVYEDRVRIYIGRGYGTCNEKEGWFGWGTSNERHQDWLSLALTAKASSTKVSFYDEGNSCNGLSDAVRIEGVFLPIRE